MNIKKNFGRRVKELRLLCKMTQEELAEKIGMSPKTLSQIELGGNFVSADTLELICKALNVLPEVLFNFKSYEKTPEELLFEIENIVKGKPELTRALYKIALALTQ